MAHYEKGITGDNKVTLNKDKICIIVFGFVVNLKHHGVICIVFIQYLAGEPFSFIDNFARIYS